MHGRPRVSVDKAASEPEQQKAAADRKKAALYGRLLAEVLASHKACDYSKGALEKSARLLELNPEVSTAWNFRKRAVIVHLQEASEEESNSAFLEDELRLSEKGLQRNPKSYGAWYHRTWTMEKMIPNAPLQRELKLIGKLLTLDPRNFHGWGYRRFIADKAKRSPADELAYTMEKVEENFSSYSAWHQRSWLLPKVEKKVDWLTEEFNLVKNAFFTEPDDQSGWMYHLWLLQNTINSDIKEEQLQKEVNTCRELLELEPDGKWPLLTLARLLTALGQPGLVPGLLSLYNKLIALDPMHKEYYNDIRGQLNLEEAIAQLIKPQGIAKLELSKLGLGSIHLSQKFGNLKELDLSHNNLRCVQGLECLSSLTLLKLSHNKIAFASGLGPLCTLQDLRTLDLSWNRLGALPVDFCLYCISQRTESSIQRPEEDDNEKGEHLKLLERVLGSLRKFKLEALCLEGNEITSREGLKEYLHMLLPTLLLLDRRPLVS